MSESEKTARSTLVRRALIALRRRFSLREDKADNAQIDEEIRAGIHMKGTNLWVLMFAIFIASIGLNVNSTAVIIGAMLISPLMGPIVGAGYAMGIHDFELVRRSLKNLGIATLIALLTSTVYFAVSPLTTVQSELLARTTPTIWDVLIALFGGLAGIVAATRADKTNVVPGVAIATALMPPLCTAGFGLATGNWRYFFGAFYLFTINAVFIAYAATLVTRAMRLPRKAFLDPRSAARVRFGFGFVILATVAPSLYLAYGLVVAEVFKSRAMQFVDAQPAFQDAHVAAVKFDPRLRRIDVTLVGETLPEAAVAEINQRLPLAGLPDTTLRVIQSTEQKVDVAALKADLLRSLYQESQAELAARNKRIEQLEAELRTLATRREQFRDVPMELHAINPAIRQIYLAESAAWDADQGLQEKPTVLANLRTDKPLSREEARRIEDWLRARIKAESVKVVAESGKR